MNDDVLSQFQQFPATCLSDAMQGLNNLDSAIKPLNEAFKIAGRAVTVKMPVGDNSAVLRALLQAKPGDILAIDAKGDLYRAVAGDFVVGLAQTLGLGGIVVDGVIRDVIALKNLNFAVFCRGTTVAASGKFGGGEVNVPISCGGVNIQPGDLIVGDGDGVVVVPQASEQAVLKRAAEKLAKDEVRAARYGSNAEMAKKYLAENA